MKLCLFLNILRKFVDAPNSSIGRNDTSDTISSDLCLSRSNSEFCVPNKKLQILEKFTKQNTAFSSPFSQTFSGGPQSGTEQTPQGEDFPNPVDK